MENKRPRNATRQRAYGGGVKMPNKKIIIDNKAWERVKKAFASVGIPEIEDPKNPDKMIPQFTETEWVYYCIKRFVARKVYSYEKSKVGIDNAPQFNNNLINIS